MSETTAAVSPIEFEVHTLLHLYRLLWNLDVFPAVESELLDEGEFEAWAMLDDLLCEAQKIDEKHSARPTRHD